MERSRQWKVLSGEDEEATDMGEELRLSGEEGQVEAIEMVEEPLRLARGSDMTRPLVLPATAAVERELARALLVSQVAPCPLASTSTSSVEESVARAREVIMYALEVSLVTMRAMAAWMKGVTKRLKFPIQKPGLTCGSPRRSSTVKLSAPALSTRGAMAPISILK